MEQPITDHIMLRNEAHNLKRSRSTDTSEDELHCAKQIRLLLPYTANIVALCDKPLFSDMLNFDTENIIVSNLSVGDVYRLRLVCRHYRVRVDKHYNQLIIDWNLLSRHMHPINIYKASSYEEMKWVYVPPPKLSLSWPRVVSLDLSTRHRSRNSLDSLKLFPCDILEQTEILLLNFADGNEHIGSTDFRPIINYLPKSLKWIVIFGGYTEHFLIDTFNHFSMFDWVELAAERLQLPLDHFIFSRPDFYIYTENRQRYLDLCLFNRDFSLIAPCGTKTRTYIHQLLHHNDLFRGDCIDHLEKLLQNHSPTFVRMVSNGTINQLLIMKAIENLVTSEHKSKQCAQIILSLINHAGIQWESIKLYKKPGFREHVKSMALLQYILDDDEIIEGYHDVLAIALIRASTTYTDKQKVQLYNLHRLNQLASWQKFQETLPK